MNAKTEFLEHVNGKEILCAQFASEGKCCGGFLKTGFSEAAYRRFLSALDFEYDEEFGVQELYGTIWYKDGTWSSRGEFSGSEWWEYNKCPEIPEELK